VLQKQLVYLFIEKEKNFLTNKKYINTEISQEKKKNDMEQEIKLEEKTNTILVKRKQSIDHATFF